MRRSISFVILIGVLLAAVVALNSLGARPAANASPSAAPAGTSWSFDASYIEACSCHLFCPCYSNPHPEPPYCEFNMAVVVNDGMVGDVSLKGARYWLTGDLGDNFGEGKTPWLGPTLVPQGAPAPAPAPTTRARKNHT